MRILRSILPPSKKIKPPPEKKLNLPPLENLEHPDKKLNSLGIILIPWKNLKTSEKYQHAPSKKFQSTRKTSFSNPEKSLPSWKKPQPLHLKKSQSLQNSLTPTEKFSTPLK